MVMLGTGRVNHHAARRELLAGMVRRRLLGIGEKENSVPVS
jgi:hypothetical protein